MKDGMNADWNKGGRRQGMDDICKFAVVVDTETRAGEVRRGASLILLRRSFLLYALTSIIVMVIYRRTTTRPHFIKEGIILIPKAHLGVVFSTATSRHMGETFAAALIWKDGLRK
ncbi:unnamed protein product [Brugia pahangi]|uniref:Transmembrane protein n=1 Tax=Brugia pahangi TaxID=6280 RepID=A0A0N4SY56_BRUPA|nr:unnamed protein product [Brugia pahangi]